MTVVPSKHDFGTATISTTVQAVVPRVIFDGITLPNRTTLGAASSTAVSAANQDLADVLNALFNHPSCGHSFPRT